MDFSGIKFFHENNLDDCTVEGAFEIFGQIQNFYHDILDNSVNERVKDGSIEDVVGKDFYNYVLIDAEEFYRILSKYNANFNKISRKDFLRLKKCIFYVGKGRNGRKFKHVTLCKTLFKKKLKFRRICAKFSKISRLWESGKGIICLQLFHETSHYMAHNREFAIIKTLVINRLTNSIHGTAYGDMRDSWNFNEIFNFGNMILYNAFKMCCIEPPSVVYQEDVMYKPSPCTKLEKEWELFGVLEYFLELEL